MLDGESATRATRSLPHDAARGLFGMYDGIFGNEFAASVERELESVYASHPGVSGGDMTIFADAWTIDAHPTLGSLIGVKRVARFLDGLREALDLKRTVIMVTCYPGGGTAFNKHFDSYDRSARDDSRYMKWTSLYYPNSDWSVADGGQLRLYSAGNSPVDVTPAADRALLFDSAATEHEVLPTFRRRFAITGWFYACSAFAIDASPTGELCKLPRGFGYRSDGPLVAMLHSGSVVEARGAADPAKSATGLSVAQAGCSQSVCAGSAWPLARARPCACSWLACFCAGLLSRRCGTLRAEIDNIINFTPHLNRYDHKQFIHANIGE